MSSLTFPHIWTPRREWFCLKCGKPRLAPRPKRRSLLRRMLDPLAVFAAGDVMLDTSGNVILDASGNVLLDDGAGNSCCCGCDDTGVSNCPSGLASHTFQGVASGTTLITPCVQYFAWAGGTQTLDFLGNSMDGTYCFTGPNDWTFAAITLNSASGSGAACPSPSTNTMRFHLTRYDSTTWICDGTNIFLGEGRFSAGIKIIHFYGEATVSDCSSDFTITNSLPTSVGGFTIPKTCAFFQAGDQPAIVGWAGSISFVHCGC